MSGRSGGSGATSTNIASDQPMDLAQKSQPSASAGNENVKAGAATLVHFGSSNPISGSNVTCKPVTTPVSVPHIPRGAAVVANLTSRSHNLTSIVRTTSHGLGPANSASLTAAPRASFPGQRFPMASNSWVNRGATLAPAASNKLSVAQLPGRATITTARPSQTTMMPITTYSSGTVKPGGTLVSSNIRSSGTALLGPSSGEGIRHALKGAHVAHTVQQKYIGAGRSNVRSTMVSANISGNALYSPTATLVTSLASSGTTITAHPANRGHTPPNALRITSAVPSSTASGGAISLTSGTSSSSTALAQHPSPRNLPLEHHIPIKTPFVRAPQHGSTHSSNLKGNTQTLPAGTQISLSGPKIVAHPTTGVAIAQIGNVTGHKTAGSTINPVALPFQPRTGTVGGGTTISRIGSPAISMTKVNPKVPHRLGSPSSPNEPSQSPHTNVFLHRNPHSASSVVATQSERLPTTVPQYSITAPYYLESQSSPSSFSVNPSIVHQSNHFAPTSGTDNGGAIRMGGNNSFVSASDGHSTAPISIMKPNSSPRPTILRKRTELDGNPLKAAKNLTSALNQPIASPPSPKRPDSRGNGNASSGSTTISANSSPGTQPNEEDASVLKKNDIYEESLVVVRPPDVSSREVNKSCFSPYPLSVPQPMDGVSPRKKPRKQQLMGNELQEVHPCEEEEFQYQRLKEFAVEPSIKSEKPSSPVPMESDDEEDELDEDDYDDEIDDEDDEIPKVEVSESSVETEDSAPVRPHMSLLSTYRPSWKARNNHFVRHSDVKPKEDKRKTVSEVAGNKQSLQRVNGWKVMHVSGQVEELMDLETEVGSRLKNILTAFEKRQQQRKLYKDFDKDIERLSELVKSNIQRSVTIKEQMYDAKGQMHKLFDHKENVIELLTKYSSKRTLRKKEKY